MMSDESILSEADRLIHGERHTVYGDATADFTKTANLWNAMLGDRLRDQLGPQDVALMMALLKISRESHQHKRDNNVDAIGYIALGHDIAEGKSSLDEIEKKVFEHYDYSPVTDHVWLVHGKYGPMTCHKCGQTSDVAAFTQCPCS